MGRDLDPDLDLWKTAKPYLENWMHERIGLKGLKRRLDQEAGQWAQMLPQLPRLVHASLSHPDTMPGVRLELERLRKAQEFNNRLVMVFAAVVAVGIGVALWAVFGHQN